MKIGLIGLPSTGKSTLFHLLTGVPSTGGGDRKRTIVGTAPVPDPRIDVLVNLYQPQKVTPATLTVVEIPGFVPSNAATDTGQGGGPKGLDPKEFVDALRDVDALVHVVRAFDDPTVPHVLGEVNPMRDMEIVFTELLSVDWQLVQTRLERLASTKKRKPDHDKEVALLTRIGEELENNTPIVSISFTDDDRELLRAYTFFTEKPLIVAINADEARLQDGGLIHSDNAPVVSFAALVEAEIRELDADDRKPFMDDLGITESGIERLAQAAYARLGRISFFTVGTDEVRAWTIRRGANAQEAASAIHSDISRGFIRAEVAGYDELVSAGGWNRLKERGGVRLEGKEYIVGDGDVMSFRFNV